MKKRILLVGIPPVLVLALFFGVFYALDQYELSDPYMGPD